MAKQHQRKKLGSYFSAGLKNWLLVIFAFSTGYYSATVFDMQKLVGFVNSKIFMEDNAVAVHSQLAQKDAKLPKPKLEFYTLLTTNTTFARTRPVEPEKQVALIDKKAKPVEAVHPETTATATTVDTVKENRKVMNLVAQDLNKEKEPLTKKQDLNKSNYSIQVAAFRARSDAEQLRAGLLMKGIESSVQAIKVQNSMWFRVTIGPFESREKAEKMQTLLARRERLSGMIRKTDV